LGLKVITKNRKAFFDYHIEETIEAGIVLTGNEIKSIRLGRVNLKDSFARIMNGEVYLLNMHISPYNMADGFSHEDPERRRKLLLHRREIKRLIGKTRVKGFTLVPTKLYFKRGKVKVEIALGRGKTHYDKRESIKRKESDREMERAMKRVKGG
jgi:SsrA-binding protein